MQVFTGNHIDRWEEARFYSRQWQKDASRHFRAVLLLPDPDGRMAE